LEHLDDQTLKKGLSEIYRVLKKEGYFIITTPYKENLEQSMVVCPKCHTRFHRIGHVSSFDETKIKKIFIKNNLTIVKLRILPLGSFARHPFLKYFWKIFNKLQLGFKPSNLFVIAKK